MRFLPFLHPSLLLFAVSVTPGAVPAPAQAPLQGVSRNPHLGHLPVVMPVSGAGDGQVQPAVLLSDILGTQRSLTTFFSLSRLHESTTEPLSDPETNTTVLAPSNTVIESLPRKPWEDPRDYAALGSQAYDGSGGKDRADENLRRFVEAHLVVGTSPWEEGAKVKTAVGRQIWWETKKEDDGNEEKRIIMPDKIEVERVASQVANGEVWILKGVLNYA